jgi:hypothetical protein
MSAIKKTFFYHNNFGYNNKLYTKYKDDKNIYLVTFEELWNRLQTICNLPVITNDDIEIINIENYEISIYCYDIVSDDCLLWCPKSISRIKYKGLINQINLFNNITFSCNLKYIPFHFNGEGFVRNKNFKESQNIPFIARSLDPYKYISDRSLVIFKQSLLKFNAHIKNKRWGTVDNNNVKNELIKYGIKPDIIYKFIYRKIIMTKRIEPNEFFKAYNLYYDNQGRATTKKKNYELLNIRPVRMVSQENVEYDNYLYGINVFKYNAFINGIVV